MMIEKNELTPLGGFANIYSLEALVDDYDGLSLFLQDKGGDKSKIVFETFLSYRNSNESERIDLVNAISRDGLNDKLLLQRSKSEFLEWIVSESKMIRADDELYHFIVFTPEDIIEIISHDLPIIGPWSDEIRVNISPE